MSQSLGQQIRQARKAKGITQEELAKNVPVSRQTISSWENDRTQPDFDTLRKLTQILEVDVGHMFDGEETGNEAVHADPLEEVESIHQPEQTETAEADAEMSQETRRIKSVSPIKLLLLCSVVLISVLSAYCVWRITPGFKAPQQAWFLQENTRMEDACYVELYSSDTPVVAYSYPPGSDPTWSFRVFLVEKGGVEYEIQHVNYISYEKTWFNRMIPNEQYMIPPKQVISNVGKGPIGANEVRMFQISIDSGERLDGAGILVETIDAKGNEQTFRCYVPFAQ